MTDDRIKRSAGKPRTDRAMQDRAVTQSRVSQDDVRVEHFRAAFFKNKLPDLPNIPGYHVIWLSTTHQADTIPQRRRLGYEPIKASDIPDWDLAATINNGEHSGFIGINEMLAFKIPLGLYQKYMEISHHEAPMEEEQKLVEHVEELKAKAQTQKGRVVGELGFDSLSQPVPVPDFIAEDGGANP